MTQYLKRWMSTAAVVLCCLLAMGIGLTALQRQITQSGQRASQTGMLEEIRQMMVSYARTGEEIQRSFDEVYKSKAGTLAYMVAEGIDAEPGSDGMKNCRDMLEVTNALLLDRQGNVLAEAEGSASVFTQRRFNQLRTVFSKGEPSRAFTVDTNKGPRRYYGARIDDERMAVIEQSPEAMTALLEKRTGMENLMSHIRLGSSGYACAIRVQDYSILYHPNAELLERDAIAEGLTEEALTDGYSGLMRLGGEEIYASVARQGDLYILCAMPIREMNDASHRMVLIVMLIFGVVVLLIGAYAVFLQDAQEEDAHSGRRIAGKVSALSAIGLLVVFIASFYVQTLYGVSQISVAGTQHIEQIEETLAQNEADMAQLRELYSVSYLSRCRAAAYILQKKPSLGTHAKLQKLSEALDVEAIYLYNRDGELDATSTPYSNLRISQEPQDQSFAFNKLLMGLDHLVQKAMADEITGEYRQYIGVSMRDAEGNANGLVQISLVPEKLGQAVAGFELPSILSTIRFEQEGYAFAVDKSDGTILYHPQRKYIGLPAVNCGMEPYELRGEYCGYVRFGGEKLFTVSMETEDALIYAAMQVESMENARMTLSLMTTGVSLVCMALLSLLLSFQDSAHNRVKRRQEKARFKIRMVKRGGIGREEHREHRDAHKPWSALSPERRVLILLKSILSMAAGFFCMALFFGDWIFDEHSIFFYIVGGNWRKGVNIFSLTASLMVICSVSVLTNLLSRLLQMIARNFDAHTATLCHLLTSCIRYLSVLVMLCFCLTMLGVDTKALLASFGLVTAALTFGAKESVADIIAGLFIIFENEFRVDDFVTIDGWRGRVLEIGIRTTKVVSDEGDIKIFANSSVRGVVNMTKESSIAICMLCVDYRESLERVEGILREELPRIAERIPQIRRGPVYKGVPQMQDSGVQLRIDAYCTEEDRPQVIRSLNRELKIMCDKWKICIPFPQVVLNTPDSFDNLPEAGKQEHIPDITKEGTEGKTA